MSIAPQILELLEQPLAAATDQMKSAENKKPGILNSAHIRGILSSGVLTVLNRRIRQLALVQATRVASILDVRLVNRP